MNLLSRVIASIKDRRQVNTEVKEERRGGMGVRLKAASHRVDSAIEDLHKTLTMSRADFASMLAKDAHLEAVKDVGRIVHFETFAEICEFRYSPENSLMRLCKNPEHEAAMTGIASCNARQCPKMPRR